MKAFRMRVLVSRTSLTGMIALGLSLLSLSARSDTNMLYQVIHSQVKLPSVITLSEVSLDYRWFKPGGTDPLMSYNGLANKEPGGQVDLNVNMDVLDYLYFNNTVHSMIDRDIGGQYGQFRLIGWHFQVGMHLSQYCDIYMDHFSQHLLDTTYALGHFPVTDGFGVKVYFLRDTPAKHTVVP